LRDYGVEGQLGTEPTPEAYVECIVAVFREVRRVLADDATLWLNVGDSYARDGGAVTAPGATAKAGNTLANVDTREQARAASIGLKPKDLVGIPWMLAFALRADGWYLRSDIIWHKPNPMPESVTDRPTKAHEYLFLLSKRERYYYDQGAIREVDVSGHPSGNGFVGRQGGSDRVGPQSGGTGSEEEWVPGGGRNKRSVWSIPTAPFPDAHFATFPPDLVKPCILAGCPEGGVVLDPFVGSGTTAMVAKALGRKAIGIDLNATYLDMAIKRNQQMGLQFVS